MHCARCAIDHPDDKQLCTACGDPLVSTDVTSPPFPRCSNCGEGVSATDHFCPGCGTRHGEEPLLVSGADLSRGQAERRGDEKRPELRRASVRVVSGLVLALLVVLGVEAYRSRDPSGAAAPAPSATSPSAIAGVATADDIGIKIVGAGAADPARSEVVVRQTIEQHFAELQQSYLTALNADSDAEGVVMLHMTVAADGTVAYVRSTALGITDGDFITTIERQAAAWRFLPSAGLVSVHYPLVFHLAKTSPHELVMRLQGPTGPEY
jgi:hypothetical protein